jgi:hypothetical protein
MTTVQNSKYFQRHMHIETEKVLNGSKTPFKDTFINGFQATSNTLAIVANATGVARIQSKAWLVTACAEANQEAISCDKELAESSLFAKLQAQELENAIKAQGGIQ